MRNCVADDADVLRVQEMGGLHNDSHLCSLPYRIGILQPKMDNVLKQ
jgi:hypothetical protein